MIDLGVYAHYSRGLCGLGLIRVFKELCSDDEEVTEVEWSCCYFSDSALFSRKYGDLDQIVFQSVDVM